MKAIKALFSRSVSRAAEWRALLYAALAFARQISALGRSQPRAAMEKLQMLEAWCICAMTEVSHQITAEGPEAEAGKPFNERLTPVVMILQMMMVWCARMKASLRLKLARLIPSAPTPMRLRAYTSLTLSPTFLDSS